ncbi:translation initiation factor IF-3 [Candidatus Chromulinivorax destructor]|uniref:Translation initiation factor IF-3 n=1 Tax=Candidatus Chromulinivorax destructor TaxID=2066483 RepID=A0A345ZA58_9BACT|nr:translation initiation factor IF-3 [Candidatus Chromulinivorax destructor]AXK60175.1 translation initiation factor IF-3 [Candidatus Chromulinivorax destructor]
MKKKARKNLINDQIVAENVQVISVSGENLGIVSLKKALELAQVARLDLVMLDEQDSEIPLVKVMDFGKNLYAKKKKMAEGKKKQKVVKTKELKMKPKIGIHDYQTKMNQGMKFLEAGNKLKVTLTFRGREVHSKDERGEEMFAQVDQTFLDAGLTNIAQENDLKAGPFWSRIYYLKAK